MNLIKDRDVGGDGDGGGEALTACCASPTHTHNGVIALEPAGAPSGGGMANQAAALSRGEYVPPAGNASADSSAGRFPNVHLIKH